MKALAVLHRILRRALDILSATLLLAVLLLVAAQVVARYLLGVAMPWSEELTRLLFVWMVMIGASRASHMRIEVAIERLGQVGRQIAAIATALLGLALLGLLARYGLDLIELTAYDNYTALGLSVQWLYRALVVGTVLWMVMLLADLVLPEPEEAAGRS